MYHPSPMTSWKQEAKLWDLAWEGQHMDSNKATGLLCLLSVFPSKPHSNCTVPG